MLLVSPSGQKFILVSDVIGGTDAVNVTWTLDDAAAALIPATGTPVSGVFKPTNYATGDTFPAPAPAGPYLSPATAGTDTLASFNGVIPNGTWSLYIVDDANEPHFSRHLEVGSESALKMLSRLHRKKFL